MWRKALHSRLSDADQRHLGPHRRVKFLSDNQLPAALARWLTAKGHDAVHVVDIG
jgi:hypothetical protein